MHFCRSGLSDPLQRYITLKMDLHHWSIEYVLIDLWNEWWCACWVTWSCFLSSSVWIKGSKTELTVSLFYRRIELHWHKQTRLSLSPSLTLLTLWIILTPQKNPQAAGHKPCAWVHMHTISPSSPGAVFPPLSFCLPLFLLPQFSIEILSQHAWKKRQGLLVGSGSECQDQHRSYPQGNLQQIGLELGFTFSGLYEAAGFHCRAQQWNQRCSCPFLFEKIPASHK